jgi:hypothetical protein
MNILKQGTFDLPFSRSLSHGAVSLLHLDSSHTFTRLLRHRIVKAPSEQPFLLFLNNRKNLFLCLTVLFRPSHRKPILEMFAAESVPIPLKKLTPLLTHLQSLNDLFFVQSKWLLNATPLCKPPKIAPVPHLVLQSPK